jgi:hypothetical protein
MKRGRTTTKKNKVAKCCTGEVAADLNPNFEILRQKKRCKNEKKETTRNKNKVAKCFT